MTRKERTWLEVHHERVLVRAVLEGRQTGVHRRDFVKVGPSRELLKVRGEHLADVAGQDLFAVPETRECVASGTDSAGKDGENVRDLGIIVVELRQGFGVRAFEPDVVLQEWDRSVVELRRPSNHLSA